MQWINGSAVFGQHDANTLAQLDDVASRAERAAIMADGHFGYIMPVGGVAAYRNKVSVAGVGYDIACGNAAIRTDLTLEGLTGMSVDEASRNPSRLAENPTIQTLADEIASAISFGMGRKNKSDDAPVNDPLFVDDAWWILPNTGPKRAFREELQEKARRQLGTVGSGNHYVDVFADENGAIWVGVHFGSRGFGHTIATSTMAVSQGKGWGERPDGGEVETLLDLDSTLGQEYWGLMNLAGRYAYAGREWVTRKVVRILGGTELDLVHNHHNFAWKELHAPFGAPWEAPEELVVVRKGATPAFPGQRGFIGGSMGDNAVIVRGSDIGVEGYQGAMADQLERLQQASLFSTVHGAGRVMSRTEAAGKRHRKTGQLLRPGKVTPQMMHEWIRSKGVTLRGGGLDESPHAYRRLPEVLEAQEHTVNVLHTLRPIIVVMAGADEFDPYVD